MTKNSKYWANRKAKDMWERMELAEEHADEIAQLYYKGSKYISYQLQKVFERYMRKHNLSKAEAMRLLHRMNDKNSIEELKRLLAEETDSLAKQELLAMLEAPAYQARLEHWQQLQNELDRVMQDVYKQEKIATTNFYVDFANESYYRTIFNIQSQTGLGFSFATIDPKIINRVINANWSGTHYSKRIWKNVDTLTKEVKEELMLGIITGKTENEMANEIANKFGQSAIKARRLIRTESCYLSTRLDMEAYKECEIEMYMFLATLDLRTSTQCRELDGKVFDVNKEEVGVNSPPMHPWCRSTTVAYTDEETSKSMKRRARNPETGRNELVDGDMTYKEWYGKYVLNKVKPVQNYKTIELDTNNPKHEKRGSKELTMYHSKNTINNIYISKEVKLKRKQLHEIDSNITKSLKKIKAGKEKPNIAIISSMEMQTSALASYNPVLNVIYINEAITNKEKLLELQKDCACPTNELSTYVHELLHWKDATQYRQKCGAIKNNSTYINILRRKHKKQVDILENKGYNISQISQYANKSNEDNAYDEVFTEYRVKKILGG